jgi:N-methylhydantoinase A
LCDEAGVKHTLIGIDIGGTFTDFVLSDGDRLELRKVPSTPSAPEQAILAGLASLDVDLARTRIVHGSTVAINAVLEGRGARCAFVTNRGFADLLTIARQARRELYNLQPEAIAAPVPRDLCLETGGRLAPDGSIVDELSRADLDALREAFHRLRPEAVAICLLFAFLDDRFERAVEAVVPEGVFVSRSSAVLPQLREYERAVATWLNARVGPLVQGYLRRLERLLAPARLAIMQNSGVTSDPDYAGRHPVRILMSGPAGGIRGAEYMAALGGCRRLLTFDMGGTSTDVAMVDGEPALGSELRIAGYPIGVPSVDVHSIGAGGGSIACVDAGGLLRVGPQSAGADPGPACYGRGGSQPTVTDANVVLGRIPPGIALAGGIVLDRDASTRALAELAARLGLESAQAAALGVIRVINEHMAQALRVMSVHRGLDPRDFVLTSFGGAGALHLCALADRLGMTRALIPNVPGVLSALGMVVAAPGRDLTRTVGRPLAQTEAAVIEAAFAALERRGGAELAGEGVAAGGLAVRRSLDLCYRGQSCTLEVPWNGRCGEAEARFHDLHERHYGHRLAHPVELVNVRVGLRAVAPQIELPPPRVGAAPARPPLATLFEQGESIPVWPRDRLGAGQRLSGPAIIVEPSATGLIERGWQARVDACGNLHLTRDHAA